MEKNLGFSEPQILALLEISYFLGKISPLHFARKHVVGTVMLRPKHPHFWFANLVGLFNLLIIQLITSRYSDGEYSRQRSLDQFLLHVLLQIMEQLHGRHHKDKSGFNLNREKNYEIPNENLEGKYKDWQKKLHPDLVHSKSERERTYAAEQSSRVIDAYRTLSNPLSRAIYLMRLEGVEVDEEQTVSEPELLAEIMEIREAVEEASDAQTLSKIQAEIEEKLKNWSNSFGDAFLRQQYEEALTEMHSCVNSMKKLLLVYRE